ncbi:MAG: UDP-N-acetylmuramoyl-L-alanine--D-glutamate ligase [Verrucomicrobia bacterium]|nr:UDP-N-acetylmuramoyl-L-alanine--D-glutamate ligase [Verrucomicrobiota bacterium]
MNTLRKEKVLVAGLGASGEAAARLLIRLGAAVHVIDGADYPRLRSVAEELRSLGATVELGVSVPPETTFDFAVVSPGISLNSSMLSPLGSRKIRVIGELELGYQYARCLNISITGTNGKTTTTELVDRLLSRSGRRTIAAGNIGTPICDVVEQSREIDFLTLEVSSFQLETTEYFRPAVAVLLNITPDHLDRYVSMNDYVRAKSRLFQNQQPFDWAVIQSEALAQLRSLNLPVPSKIITFSANNRKADLYLDRGLLISRLRDWTGPLLDMDRCELEGPHNAENLMAALAVGRVLRVSLPQMAEALCSYRPAPHRCEKLGEFNGVRFVNDSKATNLDAVHKALLAVPSGRAGKPNVFLIAGGRDKGLPFHDVGPVLARRVKHAFLLGEAREKIRAAWSLFTPCSVVDSLLEAVSNAVKSAATGDIVLLSPGCSSFDMFQNYQHRGDVFRQAVETVKTELYGGAESARTTASRRTAKNCPSPKISTRGNLKKSPTTNNLSYRH